MTVLCGHGNNGGDGYIVARLAKEAGWSVLLLQAGDESRLKGDAAKARDLYLAVGGIVHTTATTDIEQLAENTVVVDALLGTGINQAVTGKIAELIHWVNHHCHLAVCSVDLPSGLDANTGRVLGCAVKADFSCTFVAVKRGLSTAAGPDCCGQLYFAGLGIDEEFVSMITPSAHCMDLTDIHRLLPPRRLASHKGSFGHVMLLGSDSGMSGAIRMAAMASLRTGAGLVSVLTAPACSAIVASGCAEVMVHGVEIDSDIEPWLQRADVIVIGPGLGQSVWGQWLLQQVVDYLRINPKKALFDADALNLMAQNCSKDENWGFSASRTVITPHPLEAARLLACQSKDIQQDRFAAAALLSQQLQVITLLKGVGSIIYGEVEGEKCCYLNNSGNPGMATAGMGDVLSGIIAALMAQGLSSLQSAALGAYIHGKAADIAALQGQRGMMATDLLPNIRTLVNDKRDFL